MTSPPPDTLPEAQQAIWAAAAAAILDRHPRARIDPAALAAYTAARHEWDQLDAICRQSAPLTTRDGKIVPNPAYTQRRHAAQVIIAYAARWHLDQPGPAALMHPAPPAVRDAPVPCGTCGEVHNPAHCDGHSKRTHRQCGNGKGKATDHQGTGNCYRHFGNTPGGRAHAAKEQVGKLYLKLASRGEVEPMADPLAAIAAMSAERQAWADAAVAAVNELPDVAVLDERGQERLRVLAGLAERMSDRAFRAAVAMAELDIDERLAAVQARAVGEVAERVIAALDAFKAEVRGLVEPLLAEGRSWPSDGEIEGLMDAAVAQVSSPG